MKHRLARSNIVIIDYPEAIICKTVLSCNFSRNMKGVTNYKRILLPQVQRINEMSPRNNQHMQRSYRRNILYYNKVLILVDLAGRYLISNYLAEKASIQFHPPFQPNEVIQKIVKNGYTLPIIFFIQLAENNFAVYIYVCCKFFFK